MPQEQRVRQEIIRKLLSGIIESVGIEPVFVSGVILSINKLEKIGSDGVESELLQLGIAAPKINMLLSYMKMQPDELTAALVLRQRNSNLLVGKILFIMC
jgi:SOS response regulatory protein OraA/RecX